jgi:hypothetical protein
LGLLLWSKWRPYPPRCHMLTDKHVDESVGAILYLRIVQSVHGCQHEGGTCDVEGTGRASANNGRKQPDKFRAKSSLRNWVQSKKKCIPACRNVPLSEKESRYFERRHTTSAVDHVLRRRKDLRDVFISFLYHQGLFRGKLILMWRDPRISISWDEGCISSSGWRFSRPIVKDKANAS